LDGTWVEAMVLAGREANRRGIPIVFDPVGAGATCFRTETPEKLLSEISFAVVCGNAGEISTLAGLAAEVRGVESIGGDAREAVEKAARLLGTTVAATGEVDYVCDGERLFAVKNGHPLMGRIVGSGCASTAVVGCFAAAGDGGVETVAASLAYFGLAGEAAAEGAEGPGTFEPRLLDALAALAVDPDGLDGHLVVEELPLA
ncbi:MAG: hydroxyethylthiazole kinase, partial [Actinomycetota bacterium]|nr:hydroxyethylthiazole kinase [Actinomycetota bacterium]